MKSKANKASSQEMQLVSLNISRVKTIYLQRTTDGVRKSYKNCISWLDENNVRLSLRTLGFVNYIQQEKSSELSFE